MKTTLAAAAMLMLGALPVWGDPESSEDDAATVWLCTADACMKMDSVERAEAQAEEASSEGRPAEVVVVTAPAPSPWQEWEYRDSVYDDWDFRDPTDY
jgi:hypothetical protein